MVCPVVSYLTTQAGCQRRSATAKRFAHCWLYIRAANQHSKTQGFEGTSTVQSEGVIDGLALRENVTIDGLTVIEQEAVATVTAIPDSHLSHGFMEHENIQDLRTYFSRPRYIARADVNTAVTRSGFWDIDTSYLFNTVFPTGAQRLAGVYGIRFDLVFTLQVAASPFTAGMLGLGFQYIYGEDDAKYKPFDRGLYPFSLVQLPHVRLDFSNDTMVQLKVPFISPIEFLPLGEGNRVKYGRLSLIPLITPTWPTGDATPKFSVMLHLENVQCYGAVPEYIGIATFQSGFNVDDQSQRHPYTGDRSRAALSFVSDMIPSLKSVSQPASWYLSKVAGLMRAFGYSKPAITEPVMRMHPQQAIAENNVDLATPVIPVSPFSTTSLAYSQDFAGSDMDEMSLAFVLSKWSYIMHGTVGTSSPSGTHVYGIKLSPMNMRSRFTASVTSVASLTPPPYGVSDFTKRAFYPSNILYAANFFHMWRGGFKFRITFGKTKFHVGRVLLTYIPFRQEEDISYTPTQNILLPVVDAVAQPTGLSKIFDLRDGNVVEFECPYMSPQAYTAFQNVIGSFTMTILDALQAPLGIAPTINYIVEVAAMPGFELACPRSPLWAAVPDDAPIFYQSSMLGPSSSDKVCNYAVGECVTSYKQLIMTPTYDPFLNSVETNVVNVLPWYWLPSPPPGVLEAGLGSFSIPGMIAQCYTFVRGSTDFHLYTTSDFTVVSAFYSTGPWGGLVSESPDASINPFLRYSNTSNNRVLAVKNGTLHVKFPAYHTTYRVPPFIYNKAKYGEDTDLDVNRYCSPCVPKLFIKGGGTGAAEVLYTSRSAGDDAMCGLYIGPVPLLFPIVGNENDPSTIFDATNEIREPTPVID